jgi:hypothetical protein
MKTIIARFKHLFILNYFLLGFAIAFVVHNTNSCNEDDFMINIPETEKIDVGLINKGAKRVEQIFKLGEPDSVKNVLTEEAISDYSDKLEKINGETLQLIGKALSSRKLKVYTDMYAEYNYTMNGIEYSIALARQEDGSWKLMRF